MKPQEIEIYKIGMNKKQLEDFKNNRLLVSLKEERIYHIEKEKVIKRIFNLNPLQSLYKQIAIDLERNLKIRRYEQLDAGWTFTTLDTKYYDISEELVIVHTWWTV